MSFHDNLQRQEEEKRRATAWPQAVRQLCWFIRNYLRRTASQSALAVRSDLIRAERTLLDRLTIYLDGETATITPLGLHDSRTPHRGGCIIAQSSTGATYRFLWDGASAQVENHWQITRDGELSPKPEHLAVFVAEATSRAETLSEATLDLALDGLFGLSERLGARTASVQISSVPAKPREPYRRAGMFRYGAPYQYAPQENLRSRREGKLPPQ